MIKISVYQKFVTDFKYNILHINYASTFKKCKLFSGNAQSCEQSVTFLQKISVYHLF